MHFAHAGSDNSGCTRVTALASSRRAGGAERQRNGAGELLKWSRNASSLTERFSICLHEKQTLHTLCVCQSVSLRNLGGEG